eukprot:3132202-Prorocentrum_lima.AAC.1
MGDESLLVDHDTRALRDGIVPGAAAETGDEGERGNVQMPPRGDGPAGKQDARTKPGRPRRPGSSLG